MYDNKVAVKINEKSKKAPFTDFEKVNPETDIKDLNLNWREKDLPERQRTKHVHRLHPYMGKFIPQLVEIFLRKFKPNLVYDPFCGSGTTLVEANALGIDSIGTDISAFNVLITKAKTRKYDIDLLHKETQDIIKKLYLFKRNLHVKEYNFDLTTNSEYINEWFAEQTKKELLFYLHLIDNYKYKDLFKIILTRSARSARLVPHFDLDFPKSPQKTPYYCYKHRRTCKPVQEAYKFLKRYTLDTFRRVKEFSKIRTDAKVTVLHDDSRQVHLPENIDFVFTSPPYVGLIDYHEQHRYAYELLGLNNNEHREIGPAKRGKSEEAKREYIKGINQVFLHTRDYMTKNGKMAIVVNDKYGLYEPSAVGFKEIDRVERHVNRRTGRRNSAFFESILVWEKI